MSYLVRIYLVYTSRLYHIYEGTRVYRNPRSRRKSAERATLDEDGCRELRTPSCVRTYL